MNLVSRVKERSQLSGRTLPSPAPLVPSMLNTFQNRPFMTLLPAWVCDALVNAIIQSLLTYFVRYIVEPEYSDPRCQLHEGAPLFCSSEMVLGASVLAVLVAAFIGTPFWFVLVRYIGKRNTWYVVKSLSHLDFYVARFSCFGLFDCHSGSYFFPVFVLYFCTIQTIPIFHRRLAWSLTMALTNSLFFFVGKGDVMLCIIISGINGIPIGAKFLSDAILADVIDYDEFLTGARSEATYTMFKSFLPKIAAIPASAIPIALLGLFGHIPPVDGVIQEQHSTCIRPYIRVAIVGIPTALSLMAFLLKTRFPLKTEKMNTMIVQGVAKHLLKLPSQDPISGVMYELEDVPAQNLEAVHLLDNFQGSKVSQKLLRDVQQATRKLFKVARRYMVASFLFFASTALGVFLAYPMLGTFSRDTETCARGLLNSSGSSTATQSAVVDPNAFCGVTGTGPNALGSSP